MGRDKRRMAFDDESFQRYLDTFDRSSKGAGSRKNPKVDRLSALDVRDLFDTGIGRGASKAEAARMVIDYADDVRDETKMGGGTERALNRLREYLDKDVKSQPVEDEPEVIEDPTRPGTVDFETRQREATYTPFAGSYFDFVGGDPSNPADYYEGDPTRGGSQQFVDAMAPENLVEPTPGDLSSFIRSVQTGEYLGNIVEDMGKKTYVTEEDEVRRRAADGLNLLRGAFADI